jgi:4-hydroxythreonine-4-phosphate dehydrogenase
MTSHGRDTLQRNKPHKRPRIAITMGDPCGVGPEIIVKALAAGDLDQVCQPVVIGEPLALERAIARLGADLRIHPCEDLGLTGGEPGELAVYSPTPLAAEDIVYGQPTQATARAIISYIEVAANAALTSRVDAVCTCPIHKANLSRYGFAFPGHTEFLAHLTGAPAVVMMLAGPRLRVALVTIHAALARVPALLTREALATTIRITGAALLNDFGFKRPKIAVAGLNPHAGEEGKFGREELDMIQPLLKNFHNAPFEVSGPYPPDTVFFRAYSGEFDAVIAMYHDQGLIPIKLVHFHQAVNISLGLPIVRTSVDHGTAYDLAGTGKAHPGSLQEAVRCAALMAHNRFGL